MAEKNLPVVDRDVALLKVYPIKNTDVCVAMQDHEDRKCIDQYYTWEQVEKEVIPAIEAGLRAGKEIESQPVPAGQKKLKPVVTVHVINPKDEPDERCHLNLKAAEKMLEQLKQLAAKRPAA
jgi:hypothetical protein